MKPVLLPCLWILLAAGCGAKTERPAAKEPAPVNIRAPDGASSGDAGAGRGARAPGGVNSGTDAAAPWLDVPPWLFESPANCLETGVPGTTTRAWFAEDGTVQAGRAGPAFRVWLYDISSETVHFPGAPGTRISLGEGYLPFPRIRWPAGSGLEVEVELSALLKGTAPPQEEADTFFHLRIRMYHTGSSPRRIKLLLGCSPFGMRGSPARNGLPVLSGATLHGSGGSVMRCSRRPDFFGTYEWDGGAPPKGARWKERSAPDGSEGSFVTSGPSPLALLAFDLEVNPSEGEFARAVPQAELSALLPAVAGSVYPASEEVQKRYLYSRLFWEGRQGLNRIAFKTPHRAYVDAFRSAVATLCLQWIGDAAAWEGDPAELCWTAVALARTGHLEAARSMLSRLMDLQGEDGTFPASRDGVFAAQGLALFTLADHHRFFGDPSWLAAVYPMAEEAAERLMDRIEEKAGRGDGAVHAFRLYSDQGWAIQGLLSAAHLARSAGDEGRADRYRLAADALKDGLSESIRQVVEERDLAHVPAGPSDDLLPGMLLRQGVLLFPESILDARSGLVQWSFDRYWREEMDTGKPHPGGDQDSAGQQGSGGQPHRVPWKMEAARPLILVHRPDRVLECMDRYLEEQMIPGTYTWASPVPAEGPGGGVRMPSAGAAAAYVIAFRMLFVHEKGDALLLGSGLPESWFDFQRILEIQDAPTPDGPVSFSIQYAKGLTDLKLDTAASPHGGFELVPPAAAADPEIVIDGKRIHADMDFERRGVIRIPPGSQQVQVR